MATLPKQPIDEDNIQAWLDEALEKSDLVWSTVKNNGVNVKVKL